MSQISHSRVDGYLLCRRKDYYAYTLGLRRITESDSLAFGSAVHAVLEVFYRMILELGGKGKTSAVLKKQRAAFGRAALAALDKVRALYSEGFVDSERFPSLRRTIERYLEEAEPFVKKGFRVLAVEQKFALEYDSDTESAFNFVIDLIVEDPQGYYVIVDHKTTYDFYKDEAIELQGQIPKYIGAMRGLGYKVGYGVYNQLRSRPLIGSKMLKGQLIDALLELNPLLDSDYEQPLVKWKVSDLEALAVENGIKTRTEAEVEMLFQTMEFKPNAARVVRTFEEQVAVATEIRARELLPVEIIEKTAYRTANKMVCQHCPFKDLCAAELRGDSTKMMIATEFEKKEKRPKFALSRDVEAETGEE